MVVQKKKRKIIEFTVNSCYCVYKTQCGKVKNLLSTKQYFVKSPTFNNVFCKNVAFTKYLPKNVRVNFRNFHTVQNEEN